MHEYAACSKQAWTLASNAQYTGPCTTAASMINLRHLFARVHGPALRFILEYYLQACKNNQLLHLMCLAVMVLSQLQGRSALEAV